MLEQNAFDLSLTQNNCSIALIGKWQMYQQNRIKFTGKPGVLITQNGA